MEDIMGRQLILPINERYQDYLSDESRMVGKADSISFPETEEEILEIIARMRESDTQVTIQGGKTGIVGAAVPLRGHILNLSNMKQVKEFIRTSDGNYLLKVEPGVSLLELKKAIKRLNEEEELFWPPDPTESSATVGGVASCGAKGMCSYLYGDTRKYIEQIRVVHSDGTVREIKRGETVIPFLGREKDLIDIYLGSQGMFGILTELVLKLQPRPTEEWGLGFFFNSKEDVFSFVDDLMKKDFRHEGASVAAIEYMDRASIDVIEERKEGMTKIKELPSIDPIFCAMVYIEIHGTKEAEVMEIAEALMEIAMGHNSDPDKAWAVSEETGVEKLRDFRHAAAESVNFLIESIRQKEPRITKLATDMSLEEASFKSVVKKYEEDIDKADLKACIFGHIGGNHLHVNILPGNYEEYKRGTALIEKWTKEIVEKHGKISNEHGIGKLKRDIFLKTASKDYLEEIRRLKNTYDAVGMWNPGNMI
jgi:D-lactate dehydrogenase (cytochrome)